VEEARQYSAVSRLGYREGVVLGAFAFIALCLIWIVFGPETPGPRALKTDGELNWQGWFVLACALPVFLLSIPHAAHVLLRRPALEISGDHLRVWMLPYESIPLSEISEIRVDDNSIDIHRYGKKRRRINARILDQPRAFFFDEVASRLASRQIVQEK
jgi:hypothetical protein